MLSAMTSGLALTEQPVRADDKLACLSALERKVLWLSTWMIHNANHLRPNRDGLKVGGHQASSASVATLMTALYFDVLRPQDRVAVKPHASPVFHAIQYLLGQQTRDKLERFRAYGGAQSYPSRTKDGGDIVDFSTGSVGLGVGMTLFGSIAQDYLRLKELVPTDAPPGRMIALAGDAELDEGNIFEALLEGWKHDVRNLWWVIDYNRQSLDAVVSDRLFGRIDAMFEMMGWRVVTLKYGRLLEAAFARPDGHHLREWIDGCPNSLYSALVYKGGEGWREHLQRDLNRYPGIRAILDDHDDPALQRLMTNLGGHDLEAILDAFHAIADDRPTCFIAYTIKGYGLPFAGHKDNHAGLMNPDQMAAFQRGMAVPEGAEWDLFAGLDLPAERLSAFLDGVPLAGPGGAPPRRRPGSGAGEPAGAAWRAPVDPGSLRPAVGRPRRRRQRARAAHRDDLARRHRLDQSGALGQPSRDLRPGRAGRHLSRGKGGLGAALGDVAQGPAHRARHRREQSVPAAGRARPRRRRCSARACCRSAPSTTRSSSAGSMRSTMPATRMRALSWWRPRRGSRWRRKAARTSRSASR